MYGRSVSSMSFFIRFALSYLVKIKRMLTTATLLVPTAGGSCAQTRGPQISTAMKLSAFRDTKHLHGHRRSHPRAPIALYWFPFLVLPLRRSLEVALPSAGHRL